MSVNYEIIYGARLMIKTDRSQNRSFDLPQSAIINDPQKAPILSFMLYQGVAYPWIPDNKYVKMAVEVNGRKISSYYFHQSESTTERVLQEVMDPNDSQKRLNHGNNTLNFKIEAGEGYIYIQDIVIWYHIGSAN